MKPAPIPPDRATQGKGSRLYKTHMPIKETGFVFFDLQNTYVLCYPLDTHWRIRGRLSLKKLGPLAGGIHHNAVGIAIRRFTQRLQSDRTLLEKVSLIQKELEPRL